MVRPFFFLHYLHFFTVVPLLLVSTFSLQADSVDLVLVEIHVLYSNEANKTEALKGLFNKYFYKLLLSI